MASMILGVLGRDVLQDLDRLVAAVGGVEIGGELDLRVALQRRIRRHALVDLDRHRRLLHRLVEIGQRQQRQRMVGLQVQRELQIDQRRDPRRRGASAWRRCRTAPRRRRPARESTSGGSFLPALVSRRPSCTSGWRGELLVEGLVDGRLPPPHPCCATASAHRRRRRAAWNRRACRRAPTARRRPFPCPPARGSCRQCRSLKIGYHSGPVSLSILATAVLVSPAP